MLNNNYKKLIVKLGSRHSEMLFDIAQQLNCSNLRALQVCLAAEYKIESKTGRYWRAKPVKAKTLFLTMTNEELFKKDLLEKEEGATFTDLCMNAIASSHRKLISKKAHIANQASLKKYLQHFSPEASTTTITGAGL